MYHVTQGTRQITEERWFDSQQLQDSLLFSKASGLVLGNNKSVETTQGGKVTAILWNQQVRTDRTIPNNKTDIIIRDNENRTCILLHVAISVDSNVIKKLAEKNFKI